MHSDSNTKSLKRGDCRFAIVQPGTFSGGCSSALLGFFACLFIDLWCGHLGHHDIIRLQDIPQLALLLWKTSGIPSKTQQQL